MMPSIDILEECGRRMMYRSKKECLDLIAKLLHPKLVQAGISIEKIGLKDDLFNTGILDSYDTVELFTQLEAEIGVEIEFTDYDQGQAFSVDFLVERLLSIHRGASN